MDAMSRQPRNIVMCVLNVIALSRMGLCEPCSASALCALGVQPVTSVVLVYFDGTSKSRSRARESIFEVVVV